MGTVSVKSKAQVEQEAIESKRNSLVVSKFQAKTALKQFGKLGEVKTFIKSLPEDDIARIAWEDAQEFRRTSPTVLAIATQLNMTEEELDQLFEQAKTIEA